MYILDVIILFTFTFTITLTEIIDDGSATSETTTTAATITGGSATIYVEDNQAETVTVIPESTPILTAVSGTATFGTVSGSGVGIQNWREIKEPGYEEMEKVD